MRSIIRLLLMTVAILPGIPRNALAQQPGEQAISVRSAFLRVLHEARVPARVAGVVVDLDTRRGDQVVVGERLARLDDRESGLTVELAELQRSDAQQQLENLVGIEQAEAAMREGQLAEEQARITDEIARQRASDTVAVRHARKSRDASQAELNRALKARKRFKSSVSDSEVDRLRLLVERNELEIERAEFEQKLASLQVQIEQAALAGQTERLRQLKLSVDEAQEDERRATSTAQARVREAELARIRHEKHRIESPLSGVVVDVLRQKGEWVEPGDSLFRIIRLDKLLVEGYVDATDIDGSVRGARVRVTFDSTEGKIQSKGRLIFVSPEVDSVNHQVLVHAEVENSQLKLRPGIAVDVVILPRNDVTQNEAER